MTCGRSVQGGCGAAVRQGGLRARLGSRTAQRGALCRHDWPTVAQKQKSPPPAVPGVGLEGGSMLLVDTVVCGANYYAESAAVIGGPPPKTCGFRFT
jgi:hypothetical protein